VIEKGSDGRTKAADVTGPYKGSVQRSTREVLKKIVRSVVVVI